eukprot:INCI15761.1.p1 GENE.INCI15761.1~~INCI15761.1.p1  ORF type:complete len:359 (-),score=61.79 INCI15761.1:101-1177(-)
MSTTASTPTEDPATGATADSRVYTPEYSFRDLVDEAAHPRNDTLTPKEHIVEGLKACPKGARPVVLYSCGSLCPVHRQHVRLQELAKEYLEKHHVGEVHVVGGFLATSNDIYVRMKYLSSRRLSSFLEWDRRAELIRLALGLEGDKSPVADADALTGSCAGGATEDLRTSESASLRGQRKQHPFIRFDSWDGEPHKYFQEYFAAQASLQAHLDDWATEGERPRIHVLGVHGADLVSKCKAHNFFRRYGMGLVCIERPGYALVEEDTAADIFVVKLPPAYFEEHGEEDISSTMVQKFIRGEVNGHACDATKLSRMLHPAVERRLRVSIYCCVLLCFFFWGERVIEEPRRVSGQRKQALK